MPKSLCKTVAAKAARPAATKGSAKSGRLMLFGLAGLALAVLVYRRRQQARPAVEVVGELALEQLGGSWYEIAHLPNPFQKADWVGGQENYALNPDGSIDVTYSYRRGSLSAPEKTVSAKLWRPQELAPTGHLKYQPFWPMTTDYLVLDIGADYLVVGSADRKMLWIMGRKPALSQELYQALVQRAVYQGYNVSQLMQITQPVESAAKAEQVKA